MIIFHMVQFICNSRKSKTTVTEKKSGVVLGQDWEDWGLTVKRQGRTFQDGNVLYLDGG